jgi:hypothetical protein
MMEMALLVQIVLHLKIQPIAVGEIKILGLLQKQALVAKATLLN